MNDLDLSLAPDPVERLASLLRQRFDEPWVPDPATAGTALLRTRTGRAMCATPDPATNRIILQAWGEWDWVTPTAVYTADLAGYCDLDHWLSCGDLSDAGHTMQQLMQSLLEQLEPVPPLTDGGEPVDLNAAEQQLENLAAKAGELARQSSQFTARLIFRKPVAADAQHLVRLAGQTARIAGLVDMLRGHAPTTDRVPRC
ncbi:hypothetical protein ACM01_15050 [Streptomyces viridochromogenes]|uniref:Uncharacterized protein n=1 Tax=Streptomyces viridochromogenes TaxID=1938 RepID=A0A0J7ZFQ3_STRVR|nr:hypothetical protein [Streptomyces viridochromogenes]KMS74232.1 hypothetical protein ACM01_15050 [Streptomyces viridochromogenes]